VQESEQVPASLSSTSFTGLALASKYNRQSHALLKKIFVKSTTSSVPVFRGPNRILEEATRQPELSASSYQLEAGIPLELKDDMLGFRIPSSFDPKLHEFVSVIDERDGHSDSPPSFLLEDQTDWIAFCRQFGQDQEITSGSSSLTHTLGSLESLSLYIQSLPFVSSFSLLEWVNRTNELLRQFWNAFHQQSNSKKGKDGADPFKSRCVRMGFLLQSSLVEVDTKLLNKLKQSPFYPSQQETQLPFCLYVSRENSLSMIYIVISLLFLGN
jgi:hypothetical protein